MMDSKREFVFLLVLLSVVITACAMVNVQDPTSTPISAPSTNALYAEALVPETIEYCSETRESMLSDFDLPPSSRLIIKPADDMTGELWFISGNDLTPKRIPNLPQPNYFTTFWRIHPNGQWILYYSAPIEGDGNDASWMVSSIDGEQQWIVTEARHNTTARWINDHQFIITEASSRDFGLTYALELHDPFSMDFETLPLPPNVRLFSAYRQRGEHTYAIYFDNKQLQLYDYVTQTSKPVFRWLENESELFSDFLNFSLGTVFTTNQNGNFNIVVRQQYGLDIALDVDWTTMQNATNYASVMQPILLPNEDLETFFWGVIDDNLLMFDRYKPPVAYDNMYSLYTLDLQSKILHDYCIDRGYVYPPIASPDGRFVAWTVFEQREVGKRRPLEIVVMELSTGRIARLQNMEVIGWGRIE